MELKYSSPFQHSAEQIDQYEKQLDSGREWPFREALDMVNQMTSHAHPRARSLLNSLKQRIVHPDTQRRLDKLLAICDATDNLAEIKNVRENRDLWNALYSTEGYLYVKGESNPEILLVVFTTMYNNFGVSNFVLYSLLRTYGVSVLILKDCTYLNYAGGVKGFGDNLDDLAIGINSFAEKNNCSRIFVTGYSSAGFAACYVSSRIPCCGFLGFSIATDLTHDFQYPLHKFVINQVREKFGDRYLINLVDVLSSSNSLVRHRLVVGEREKLDVAFANNLGGVAGIEIVTVKDCFHDTPETLLASGDLTEHFSWLLEVLT